ncbi:MAG: 2Fe-2S iron-sulfur cluster-binding protein [Truepera sp.]|nr:2Fe-2S iron-sulfur cluster-binding protein [Truepera sp.]
MPKGETVLQTLLDAGHDPPYSCRSGICGSCRARIVRGEVQMRSTAALSNRDLKWGLVLACQARCTTAEVTLDFGS